MTDILQDV